MVALRLGGWKTACPNPRTVRRRIIPKTEEFCPREVSE
jgi:hypothetical protein